MCTQNINIAEFNRCHSQVYSMSKKYWDEMDAAVRRGHLLIG